MPPNGHTGIGADIVSQAPKTVKAQKQSSKNKRTKKTGGKNRLPLNPVPGVCDAEHVAVSSSKSADAPKHETRTDAFVAASNPRANKPDATNTSTMVMHRQSTASNATEAVRPAMCIAYMSM
eukprot:scaffold271024_cov46-Prasinocladus_malaysianus.AAC.1